MEEKINELEKRIAALESQEQQEIMIDKMIIKYMERRKNYANFILPNRMEETLIEY